MHAIHSVNVRTAFCHLVIEIQQYPVKVTAELAGLLTDLAESCSQNSERWR